MSSDSLEFEFHVPTARYRYKDSKKFLSREAVKTLTEQALIKSEDYINRVVDDLVNGDLTVADWEGKTRAELTKMHHWSYLLGRGGQGSMINSDYDNLTMILQNEHSFLRGLAQDLLAGNVSEAQLKSRVGQYLNATENTHEKAIEAAHINGGYKWERRIRTKANSCYPCIGMALAGWRQIGSLPSPGEQCNCRSNCGCYKEFSKEQFAPKQSLLLSSGFIGGGSWLS